ncbi:hypothetical protein Clacol_006547 [Clathrus columnatus]|uniref:Phospholipase A-2-activating protein n=1 Tax=Clathrus columnatus TaxID=1419009 RepID=A0AAV5AIJ7_9AGAM|nr:hypothetical protein Clacol_006547 [Clathrus columnatus]
MLKALLAVSVFIAPHVMSVAGLTWGETKVFDLASGGATTDSKSLVDQVAQFDNYLSPPPPEALWKSNNSLAAIFIGINDVGGSDVFMKGNSWDWTNVTQHGFHETVLDRYFQQVENLYSKGVRSFLFVNVPPIDRAPLFIEQGPSATSKVKASLADYNDQLAGQITAFEQRHHDLDQVTLFDSNSLFNALLDNANVLGFVNATGYCEAYQVRAVASPAPNLILSASRDTTAIAWNRNPSDTSFQPTVFHPSSRYVNAIGYLSSFAEDPGMGSLFVSYRDGISLYIKDYLVAGCQGALITVFSLQNPQPEPNYTLVGHTSNTPLYFCRTARVWKDFQCLHVLEGHQEAVWAVLILGPAKYLSGSADKTIRLWESSQTTHIYRGHNDVVRGLVLLPDIGFASCSNDSEIRVWTLGGDVIYTLSGHSSFAYSVAVLPSGDIVSSGEDRTVRIWRDGECIQTIVHPAISVWCVSTMPNGDIISGASDGVVRIFSESSERWASEAELKEYEEKISNQALNKEQLGSLKSSDIKGPDALLRPGQKDGQVLLVQEGSSVDAYQWDMSSGRWIKAGQVVDAVGSNRKQIYEGKEYDYVFDVDIQEGLPPLKLPYNASENPYVAAQHFLERNDLPNAYLDEVVKFIEKNTSGITLGTNSEYVDPFTGASRYVATESTSDARAGGNIYADPFTGASRYTAATAATHDTPSSNPGPSAPTTKIIPVPLPLTFKQANVPAMRNKTYQLNDALRMEISTSSLAISTQEMYTIDQAFDELSFTLGASSFRGTSPITNVHVDVLIQILERWPVSQRFPILDLARLISAFAPSSYAGEGQCLTFLNALFNAAEWSESWTLHQLPKSRETNVLLTLRSVANIFQLPGEGGTNSLSNLDCIQPVSQIVTTITPIAHFFVFEKVLEKLLQPPYQSFSKAHRVVLATTAFNISCISLKTDLPVETRDTYLQLILKVISEEDADTETIYRILVALGNYLHALRKRGHPRLQDQQVIRAFVESLVETKRGEERIYNAGNDVLTFL